MKLTDNEIRDINKLLEAGKPLPDKYRFLLFEDKREVELVWNGKTSEVCNIVLPFQTIEQVDEPRAEKPEDAARQADLFDLDARGRQLKGWTNKLIWGDNKLILSSLKNGPLREEIERQGGLKLIYIDPPFDVGADFSMDIAIGGETLTKKPNMLEEIAYRDTWGRGADSFIAMIYERLVLMRDLLADDGCIYVHCDWRVNSYIRLVMDEVLNVSNYLNELIWKRTSARSDSHSYNHIHDSIYYFRKTKEYIFNVQHTPYDQSYIDNFYRYIDEETGKRFRVSDLMASGTRQGSSGQSWRGIDPNIRGNHWKYAIEKLEELDRIGRIYWPKKKGGVPGYKRYLDQMPGVQIQSIWTDISPIAAQAQDVQRW